MKVAVYIFQTNYLKKIVKPIYKVFSNYTFHFYYSQDSGQNKSNSLYYSSLKSYFFYIKF